MRTKIRPSPCFPPSSCPRRKKREKKEKEKKNLNRDYVTNKKKATHTRIVSTCVWVSILLKGVCNFQRQTRLVRANTTKIPSLQKGKPFVEADQKDSIDSEKNVNQRSRCGMNKRSRKRGV